jgi:hypothetical protein
MGTEMHSAGLGIQDLSWRKAAASVSNGECVEVAYSVSAIAVRDSKMPDGPVLLYNKIGWQRFVDTVKTIDLYFYY